MNDPGDSTLERLFHEALDLPPEERARFVEQHASHPRMRNELLALLAADADPVAPLRATADDLAAAVGFVAAPLIGRKLGPYRIVEAIGQGGMGTVYRAARDDLGSQVAIKTVRGVLGDPVRLSRFRQEQRVLARLEHDRIARLHDAGVADDDTPYIVMEYVEGEPITAWCDARGLGVEERLRLFLEVCDAVAFAHRHAIVHRDLKPSNVLVTAEGHVKLLDFGVAKLLEGDDVDTTLTATGMRVLSPDHAAPEQVLGRPITTATDIYGLGALLYELLCGRPPRTVQAPDPAALVAAIEAEVTPPSVVARRAGPPIAERAPRIAGDLDAICLRALESDPARRYDAVELLRDDIVRHLDGLPVHARLPTFGYRAGKFVRRHAFGVTVAAIIALLSAGGVAGIAWQADRAERARVEAEELANFLIELFEASDPLETAGATVTARELLELGTIRAGRLGDRPEVQAHMLDAMARAFLGLGDYARADSLARVALAREQQLHGERHADIAAVLTTLGRIRREQGALDQAEPLMRQALEMRRRLLGNRHDLTTGTMIELAWLIWQDGRFDEAEALAREALAIRVDVYGGHHESIAEAMEAVALVLWNSGRDLAQAERLLRDALAMRENLWGPDDPRLEATLTPFSALLPAVGKAAEGEALARRALELRRSLYGEDHPVTTHQLNNLAQAIQAQGRLAEARELYREMLRRYQAVFTGDHPMVAVALNNVSSTFYQEGALDSAEHYLRVALEMHIRLDGPVSPTIAIGYHNLGSLQRAQGRFEDAERSLGEAYRQRIELYGADNPVALRTGAVYADALTALGKHEAAETLLRDIPAHQRAQTSEAITPDVARTMGFLAAALARRGAFAEAESLFVAALESARDGVPPTHPRRRELVDGLARLYEASGRPGDAERLRQQEAAGN